MSSVQDKNEILVFRTDIASDEDLARITLVLEDKKIKMWSVDREDADKVLRIESDSLQTDEIKRLANQAGFLCEELPD